MASISNSDFTDLTLACNNAFMVCASQKQGSACRLYLSANFTPTPDGSAQADPQDLINRIKILTAESNASDRFTKAQSTLLYILQLYKDTSGIVELVKKERETISKEAAAAEQVKAAFLAKTRGMRAELDDLQNLKKYFDATKDIIQVFYKHHPVAVFFDQYNATEILDAQAMYKKAVAYLRQTFEGCAFLISLQFEYDTVRGEYRLYHRDLRKETVDLLSVIIRKHSLPPDHFVCKMQKRLYATIAINDFENKVNAYLKQLSTIDNFHELDRQREIEWQPFYQCKLSIAEALNVTKVDKTNSVVKTNRAESFYEHFVYALAHLKVMAQNSDVYISKFQKAYERINKLSGSSLPPYSVTPDQFALKAFVLPEMDTTPPSFLLPNVPVAASAPSPAIAVSTSTTSSVTAKKKKKNKKKASASQSVTSTTTVLPHARMTLPTEVPAVEMPTIAAAPKVEKKESKEPVAGSLMAAPAALAQSLVSDVVSPPRVRRMPALVLDENSPFCDLEYNNNSVHAWFEDAETVLNNPKYAHLSAAEKAAQVRRHTFTFDVDGLLASKHGPDYIHESERVVESLSKPKVRRTHKLYSIVAQMQNGTEIMDGVITFCMDENGVCYHRYFGPKANERFFDMVMKKEIRADHDFPALPKSAEARVKPAQYSSTHAHATIDIDEMGIATIPNGDGIIRLLKIPAHLRANFNTLLITSPSPKKETK